jgi:hypothetical protein
MEIKQEVIDTVCNSLRASRQSLRNQLRSCEEGRSKRGKKEILEHQLADVEEALRVFEYLES